MIIAAALDPCAFRQQVHPVGAAQQSDFPQRGQVLHRKKVGYRLLSLLLPVDVAGGHPLQQILGLNVHQLHLIRPVKYRVGDPLPHKYPGDGCHGVVQALQMLHVDGGIHINS